MGAMVHFIGITIYGVFASGELQPWAETDIDDLNMDRKSSEIETTFVSCLFMKVTFFIIDFLVNFIYIYRMSEVATATRPRSIIYFPHGCSRV